MRSAKLSFLPGTGDEVAGPLVNHLMRNDTIHIKPQVFLVTCINICTNLIIIPIFILIKTLFIPGP